LAGLQTIRAWKLQERFRALDSLNFWKGESAGLLVAGLGEREDQGDDKHILN